MDIKFLSVAIFTFALVSCNVRNEQKVAMQTNKDSLVATMPTTTVQMLDSVYNFGKITEGENVEFSFRFKNTGKNPLVVANAAASCGCTIPEKPEQPILPGEIGFLKVKFNSENRVGMAHKTVTVTANVTPVFPEILLTGEVLAKAK